MVKKWSGKNPLYCVGNTEPHQNLTKKSSKRHPILARNGVFCDKKKREKGNEFTKSYCNGGFGKPQKLSD